MPPIPAVRALEAIPFENEGKPLVVLQDPHRFLENPISLTFPAYMLMTLMDGSRDAAEICELFMSEYKGRVTEAEVEQFAGELDELGLLLNERFEEMQKAALEEWANAPVRPAAFAAKAYPAKPDAIRKELDKHYEALQQATKENERPPFPPRDGEILRAIVAPHIDPQVGGPAAAFAFEALRKANTKPDVFIIFGTAHQPGGGLYIATDKDFETPLGRVETDKELFKQLQSRYGADLKTGDYVHKTEHSIEFQVLFLQHLYPDHDFKILPILVGSFHEYIQDNVIPDSEPEVADFSRALRDAIAETGRDVCYVAGADLSHMGQKFGDADPLSDGFIDATRKKDREMLEHLMRGDRQGFFRHLQIDEDKQKVCGLPPIYAMLDAMGDECRGELLEYDLNVEEQTQSFVSYTSMAFYGKKA